MALVSVPSWVIPGTYAENLRFLKNKKEVGGVELLFFIYNDETERQLDSEWKEISDYRERFVFTAHLPEPLLPAHESLVARIAPLARHFVFHPSAENPAAQKAMIGKWAERFGDVFLAENTFSKNEISPLEELLACFDAGADLRGIAPGFPLCMDTGSCGAASKLPLCMDTGHLVLEGRNPADYFKAHGRRIREIHLHAVNREEAALDGRLADHRKLCENEAWLLELLPLLEDYRGVINLEVFSWEEARAGIEVLKKLDRLN